MPKTVTIIAPDGTPGDVPEENAQAAMAAGGKLGIQVYSPDGQPGYIPRERLADALKAGGRLTAAPVNAGTASAYTPSVMDQFEADIRTGGARTAVGRLLGHMQGRGDRGFSGIESGVSKEAADYVGSPILGATHIAQGVSQMAVPQASGGASVKGLGTMLQGVGEAATLPSMVMAPEASAAVPFRANAARTLSDVMEAAKNQPVSLTRALEPLERTQRLAAAGAAPARVADQLYQRINTINPLTYQEARDFASNLSDLSRADKLALSNKMRGTLKQLSGAFNADVGDAAAAVGKGEDYAKAMAEYASASRAGQALKNVGKVGLGAALASPLYYKGKAIVGALSGH